MSRGRSRPGARLRDRRKGSPDEYGFGSDYYGNHIGRRPGLAPGSASGPPRHYGAPPPRFDRRRLTVLLVVALLIAGGAVAVQQYIAHDDQSPSDQADGASDGKDTGKQTDAAGGASTTAATEPASPAAPASGFATPGLLTFRGSATRSYYGEGPVPEQPKVQWSYPGASGGMCAESTVGSESKVWCGTGWTGQPSIFERDGKTWVVFGAYDRAVHFVDYDTGADILPPFPTGDIIKGSVSVDPDGFPIVYSGSRDNKMHVIAIDRPQPQELWSLDATAVSPTKWNDDWDGSPLILDDYMYEGGENSQFHVVKLNRSYAADGKVQVDPQLVFHAPGWDDELTGALNSRNNDVSIENSVAYKDGVVYFANSGGLVQGWDVKPIAQGGQANRVFRFWTGDDTDASVVIDDEGFLYVAVEVDRAGPRGAEVGQLLKLDPRKPDDPVVWAVHDPSGFWSTPALHGDLVIAPADNGTQYGVDRATGEVRWKLQLPGPTWQSAVIVDDVWIQGDCDGVLHAFDVSDPTKQPPELWKVELGGCIESTPAVWHGRIFVGTRQGRFFAIGD